MSNTRCGARLELSPGQYAECDRWTDMHLGKDHRMELAADPVLGPSDPITWPCCSQLCLKDHVHGRYRLHLGQALGHATLAARARRSDAPKRGGRVLCKICFEPGELERGRCKDRAACAERAPQLDLGI